MLGKKKCRLPDLMEPFVVTIKEIIVAAVNGVPEEEYHLSIRFSIFGLEPSIRDDLPKS